jgi:hypothetical protein
MGAIAKCLFDVCAGGTRRVQNVSVVQSKGVRSPRDRGRFCAGGTGGSEAIFRVIQGMNVVVDAGAEGTR